MTQPDELKRDAPLKWSQGRGPDVWAMFCACIAGDLSAVQALIGRDPALARCSYTYRTPIYFAVRENRIRVVLYLLEHGAYPLEQNLPGIARDRGYGEMLGLLESKLADLYNASSRGEPVASAIRDPDLAKVRQLLDADPALLKAGDARGNQPIHWAVMSRQPECIDELLARGANINAKRPDGARPCQITNGDYHYRGWRDVPAEAPFTPSMILAHLRERGAEIDICTASYFGDLELVRSLLKHDPALANRLSDYVTYYPCSGAPLRNAASAGHLEIVKLLLDHGADPNLAEPGFAPQGQALYLAATNGHYEIARLLLEHGAFPNPEVESSADALSRVISNEDERMIELLCSWGAARAVHLLAYHGDIRTAAAVFDANPERADDPAALMNAAGQGHESFVRLMLKYGPDLPKRMTFPAWSVGAKTRELNELLFQHGLNASQPDWIGITPLHYFARKGHLENASLFLEHGADINARDEDLCSTPLGWAAEAGKLAMIELLLNHGAKPNLPDDSPRLMWATPLAWATRRGHTEVVELLRSHGAS